MTSEAVNHNMGISIHLALTTVNPVTCDARPVESIVPIYRSLSKQVDCGQYKGRICECRGSEEPYALAVVGQGW